LSSRDLTFGVVGLGFGANHARVLGQLDGIRLAALCDTDERRLAAAAAGRSLRSYTDFEAMLASERLEAVVVAVPAHLHEAVALAALRAGCAVLVEKPLAPSLEDGRRLVRAAADAGAALMAGHIERFNPALQALARRVRAGDIGRVLQLTARRSGAMRLPPKDVNVVHDSALHDIDAMRFVVGADVEQVYAAGQTGIVTESENSLLGLLRFEPSGGTRALASLEVNWLSPRRLRDLAVLGDEGLLVLDYAAQTLDYYRTPSVRSGPVQDWEASRSSGATEAVRIPVEPREQLVLELEAFVTAVREGCPMPVTTQDALAALAIADAITLSARSGAIAVPESIE
jgi:predicted dehydrogenase